MRLLPILPVAIALAACSAGPAFAPDELAELRAFQARARAVQAAERAELFTEQHLFALGDDDHLSECDLRGNLVLVLRDADSCLRLADGSLLRTDSGVGTRAPDGTGHYVGFDGATAHVVVGGVAVRGWDAVYDVAERSDGSGVAIVGRRNGVDCLVVGERVFDGGWFDPAFHTLLSDDGMRIAYVQPRLLGADQWVLAPADDPERGDAPTMPPGLVRWPVRLSRDGMHWALIVAGERALQLVVDGAVRGAWPEIEALSWEAAGLTCFVRDDAGWRILLGDAVWPTVTAIGWLVRRPDGGVGGFVAREPAGERLFVGNRCVHGATEIGEAHVAADGRRWVCVSGDRDERYVTTETRRWGPFDRVHDLELDPTGEHVYWEARLADGTSVQLIDGEPVDPVPGAAATSLVAFVPDRARDGAAAAIWLAHVDGRTWLVTPAGRFGPHDAIVETLLDETGERIAYVAVDGREVWRRVAPVRAPEQ